MGGGHTRPCVEYVLQPLHPPEPRGLALGRCRSLAILAHTLFSREGYRWERISVRVSPRKATQKLKRIWPPGKKGSESRVGPPGLSRRLSRRLLRRCPYSSSIFDHFLSWVFLEDVRSRVVARHCSLAGFRSWKRTLSWRKTALLLCFAFVLDCAVCVRRLSAVLGSTGAGPQQPAAVRGSTAFAFSGCRLLHTDEVTFPALVIYICRY